MRPDRTKIALRAWKPWVDGSWTLLPRCSLITQGQVQHVILARGGRAAAAKTAASAKVVALKSAAKAKATAVDLDPLSPEGLAAQRKRLDLTVDACAALLGVSWATVHNWEKGATPRPRHHR